MLQFCKPLDIYVSVSALYGISLVTLSVNIVHRHSIRNIYFCVKYCYFDCLASSSGKLVFTVCQ